MLRIFLPALVVAVISLSEEASAASITVGPSSYSVTTYVPGDSQTLNIAQFNPALGTLTGVTFSVPYTTSGVSMTFENTQGTAQSFGIGLEQSVLFSAPGAILQTGWQDLFPFQSVAFGAFDGTADFTGPDSVIVSQTNSMLGTLTGSASVGSLSGYIGTGTFAAQIFSSGLENENGSSPLANRQDNQTGSTTGTVTVTYTFTPAAVPEPGSLVLSATAALAGLGFGWRRQSLAAKAA